MQAHTPNHAAACLLVCTARRPFPLPSGLSSACAPTSPRRTGLCVKRHLELYLSEFEFLAVPDTKDRRRRTLVKVLFYFTKRSIYELGLFAPTPFV